MAGAAIIFLVSLLLAGPPAGTTTTETPAAARSSTDMRFTERRFCKSEGHCYTYILAQGEITQESPAELESLIGQMQAKGISPAGIPVFLDSPGGLVQAGIKLGELIRRYGLATYVGGPYDDLAESSAEPVHLVDHGECLSACVWVFAGGTARAYREPGVVGVHQFYGVEKDHAESAAQTTMAYLGQYLDQMGVDRKLLDFSATVPSSEIRTVTFAQAREWRLDNFVEPAPPAPAVESSAPTPPTESQPVTPANPDHQASPASSTTPQPDEPTPHRPSYYGVQVGAENSPIAGSAPSFSEDQCRQQAQNMAQQNRWTHAPAPLYRSPLYDSRYDAQAGICYVRFQTAWDGKTSSEYLYDGATGELLARWGGDQDFLKGEDPTNTSGVLIRIHKLMEARPETQKVKP
jgi:hypothetical protein